MELTPQLVQEASQEKAPSKVFVLDFSKQEISKVCLLNSFPKLKTINLSFNIIQQVPDGAFDNLKELKELNLSCNYLSKFKCRSTSLKVLELSFNRISSLEGIHSMIVKPN